MGGSNTFLMNSGGKRHTCRACRSTIGNCCINRSVVTGDVQKMSYEGSDGAVTLEITCKTCANIAQFNPRMGNDIEFFVLGGCREDAYGDSYYEHTPKCPRHRSNRN